MGVLKAKVDGSWIPVSQGFDLSTVGYVAHAYGPSVDTNMTNNTIIPGMTVTFNAIAGHTYRIIANVVSNANATPCIAECSIVDAADAVKASQVQYINTSGHVCGLTVVEIWTASSTAVVGRKAFLTVNSGQCTVGGSASRRGILLVEDITTVAPGAIGLPEDLIIPVSDETTAIVAGVAAITFRMPFAMNLIAIPRANINTVSSSGIVTVDINEAGVSIISTKLTIDVGEKTSVTAAIPAVLSDTFLADDSEMTIDIDVSGTGVKGLKVHLKGARA